MKQRSRYPRQRRTLTEVLEIDGAALSGAGMIVRQAVAYAGVTGTPIHVRHVRAARPRPGLRHQHLCAVEAVRTLVGGTLEGAQVGSREFTFCPGGQVPLGAYRFDVGTAGSATALSLALLLVLAASTEAVDVELIGGLVQDRSPSAFHLLHVLVPLLGRMGFPVTATVVRPGYVPTGQAVLRLEARPSSVLEALFVSARTARGLPAARPRPSARRPRTACWTTCAQKRRWTGSPPTRSSCSRHWRPGGHAYARQRSATMCVRRSGSQNASTWRPPVWTDAS